MTQAEKMTHSEKRLYLITELLKEQPRLIGVEVPEEDSGQERLLRPLFNIRPPKPVSDSFLAVQNEYLAEVQNRRGCGNTLKRRRAESR